MSDERDNRFRAALGRAMTEFGLTPPSASQLDQLARHYSMLCNWNRRINLTRIIEPEQAARLHYAESLFGSRFGDDAKTLLDIGSGAGFPAVPLAVIWPATRVTALEANQKKALFLKETKDALALSNLSVAAARIEDFDVEGNELLTSRALDRAAEILPSVIARLSRGQRVMLYTTAELAAELAAILPGSHEIELNPVPCSDTRLIALISTM